ncbi:alpha/beta hydrolase [Paenibacillus chitinolyticus]|uniref:Alpha/beta fold hydrolase n=1 Tax=Paenibacillus chitinolyticus TaxID=79263 RepID=A0ABT4FHB7_9BACL|nr:alpha/beta fold hydrolase [Paenibacillus chitinolyticus]MCY9588540.1 alpha/beta fold hydrolase [Paenibacillus chitinolyticus]MCY9597910.1 alpha/beta fold hydrolase [Paenibacillus chitinolyticus]
MNALIWIVWGVVLLLIAGLLASVGIAAYVGWQLTHPKRQPVDDSPANYGLVFEEVEIASRTGDILLSGWHLPPPDTAVRQNPMTVIMSHGYAGNRLERGLPSLALARDLITAGYRVIMFDFRNSGMSQGSMTSVGYYEKHDLLGVIDWVTETYPHEAVSLIGFSMGATTSLLAAAEHEKVAAVVADSPFHHLKKYLKSNLPVWSGLPNIPFTPLILLLFPPLLNIDPEGVDAVKAVEAIYPRPVLFIHSSDDRAIPQASSEEMWRRHPDVFDFWRTAGAPHVGSYHLESAEYARRVIAFLEKTVTEETVHPREVGISCNSH